MNILIKTKLLIIILSLCFLGCVGASNYIKAGITALEIVDSFYGFVIDSQAVPNTVQAATLILQQADIIASMPREAQASPELIAQARLLQNQANKL